VLYPVVNFINILRERFLVQKQIEQLFSSYIRLRNFWGQFFFYEKHTHKMLMKLTPGAAAVKALMTIINNQFVASFVELAQPT